MGLVKHLIRSVSVVCLAFLLSGCIIAPAWGPYHPHPHYWGY